VRVTSTAARRYFDPLIGKRPWRASLGWGSFLTFEFGQRVRRGQFWHGSWHLWLYMCSWRLSDPQGRVVTSESPRVSIGRVVNRLAAHPLTGVEIERRGRCTTFEFGRKFSLRCAPFSREEEANNIDPADYWMLFMPRHMVLVARPGSRISIQRSDRAQYKE
jgi:hypothetical protein